MSESVLLRVAQGDQAGVRACIDEFGSLVWSLARRFCPNRDDAEDAVQDIFMEIWRNATRFDPRRGSEKMFVAMIARRRLIDRLRYLAHRPTVALTDELDTVAFADPGNRGELCIDAERAAAAVAELNSQQQQVIALAVMYGLSHGEIAAKTGLPLGTIKSQLRRGLIRVRELLGVAQVAVAGGER